MKFITVKTIEGNLMTINIEHITWMSHQDNEVMFFGAASVTLIPHSFQKLLKILKEHRPKKLIIKHPTSGLIPDRIERGV